MNVNLSLLWLRRDLRLHDHAALAKALKLGKTVQPVFVFDSEILVRFTNPTDRRLSFIAQALCDMDAQLKKRGGGLLVVYGKATEIIPKLADALGAGKIIAAQDFEPQTMARDAKVARATDDKLHLVKDHVIFSPAEILKPDGTAYKVFTPYSRVWLAQLSPVSSAAYPTPDNGRYAAYEEMLLQSQKAGFQVLNPADGAAKMLLQIGYQQAALEEWRTDNAQQRVKDFVAQKVQHYPTARDIPGISGTSKLSPYLRFGLVSIRECLREAQTQGNAQKWISELIWREFYAMILYHFPHTQALEFNEAMRGLNWSHDEKKLEAWKQGQTGYPIVDAAMRELLQTGWMHNRARMIVASFLTKDLHIDWRLGEEHFAQYLMDYELASNVGGWQWAASTGTDAQPWFRIFNPTLQSQKFDLRGDYIRRFVPEIAHLSDKELHDPWLKAKPASYPAPIVDHAHAREYALAMFKKA